MKTAVYQINSKYVHSSLAAWYLCAAVRERGCECEVLEGSINETEDVLFDRAMHADAQIIALSCYIWNIDRVLALAKRLKEHDPSIILVLGGPEVGYRAGSVLREYPYIDHVISGEGEVPLSELVYALSSGRRAFRIDGVSTREGEEYHLSEPCIMSTDPPCPYTDEYLSRLGGRISYIETSRGCPFSCAYCLSCSQSVRFFDVEKAKENILTLARAQTKTVKFVDRTFNADRARARELFSFIIDKHSDGSIPDGVTFHFEIAGELVDAETMDILRGVPAGLFQLEIGVQSFNPDTLRAIHRHTDTRRLCEVIFELSSYGNIHIHTDLIAGLPYEDIVSFRQSYNTLASLGSHKVQLGFLKLLHGSDMREQPELFPCEYDANAPYTVKSTPWLGEDDLQELELVERANDGIFYSGRFAKTVQYLLCATGYDQYTLAHKLGTALYNSTTPALDTLFDRMYGLCSGMHGVRADVLRDMMLYDRIAHDSSCVIPHSLRIRDPRLRELSERIREHYPKASGVRRCVGILYTEGRAIFADYDKKHPVTGLYEVKSIEL